MSVFSGGVPYAIDVKRLGEAYPVPSLTEGRVIEHDELSAVIETKAGGQRYYGVINSWISKMRNENGIYLAWSPKVGLKVLDPAGVLGHAETRTRQKIRQTGKAIRIYAWVPRKRLDATGQQRYDHDMRVAHVLKEALGSARRELAIDLAPVKSLPKPKIIRESA